IPEAWVETFDTLAQNLFLAPPTPAQYGALAALQPASLAICEERRVILSERYHYLSKALIELGFRLPHLPQGGLYIYVDIRAFSDNSLEFCQRMLADIGVATTPGIDFSASEGRYYVRFAFTAELSRLQQAVDRLAAWLPLVSTSEMDTDA
ncbi:MAG: aminotransferase, partial [Oleibacter sp.]|nr:aminotransferase [Thalassolituus sp.]